MTRETMFGTLDYNTFCSLKIWGQCCRAYFVFFVTVVVIPGVVVVVVAVKAPSRFVVDAAISDDAVACCAVTALCIEVVVLAIVETHFHSLLLVAEKP
ncbi:Hypothetical predicted protein [Octopus vulgaris]|uniref:Uncharacterized protein n=1 Tax=Octopus vulgaris TaxID=6645 RepID=A0AA36BB83_OCTVU|nr:Hypothetical predicted protein [Octopus vulgaris]